MIFDLQRRAKQAMGFALVAVIMCACTLVAAAAAEKSKKAFFGDEYDPAVEQMTAYDADEKYVPATEPLEIKDPFTYLQEWNGYNPKCEHTADQCKLLGSQTYNIKSTLRYRGIEAIGNKWMKLACAEALKAVQNGGGPFTGVIVQIDDSTGKVIRYWIGHNHVTNWTDPTAHGETTAIRQACKELGVLNLGLIKKDDPNLKLPQKGQTSHCELYTSAEPCPMCYAAIRWARIDNFYFAATIYDSAAQGVYFSDEPIYAELSLDYIDRRKLGVNVYQCTVDNSLDAFNYYKRAKHQKY